MTNPLFFLLLVCIAAATKIATEIYAGIAVKNGIVDRADGSRKLQKKPIPVSGGVAVFSVVLLSVFASLFVCRQRCPNLDISIGKITVLLASSMVLVLTGFLDDKCGMKGKKKLFLQLAASAAVVVYARNYHAVDIFGYTIELGHLFFPLALFWMVGFINAVNLIDGADGVATTLGSMIFITSGIIGVMQGRAYYAVTFLSFVMAAALFGFFLCNRPPAKIYLGDSGSMLIGFLAAILLLNSCSVGKGTIRFFPAFCIAFLPILDSFSAIVRRKLAGRSIYFADRSHLHHRIQTRIGRNWILLITLFFLQLPLSIGGTWGILSKSRSPIVNDLIPLGTAFIVLAFLIAANIFGRNELVLMAISLGRLFRRIFGCAPKKPEKQKTFINLNEDDWKVLWNSLVRQTTDPACFYLSLDINIPTLEIDFFAFQGVKAEEKGISTDPRSILTLRFPLMLDEKHYCGNLILQYNLLNRDAQQTLELTEKLKDECTAYIRDFVQVHQSH